MMPNLQPGQGFFDALGTYYVADKPEHKHGRWQIEAREPDPALYVTYAVRRWLRTYGKERYDALEQLRNIAYPDTAHLRPAP